MRRSRKIFLLITLPVVLLCGAARVRGQQPAPADATTPTPQAISTPAPIPLAEVVTRTEAVSASLRDTEADLASGQVGAIEENLPIQTGEIDARLAENERVLAANPSLDTLRGLEAGWRQIDNNFAAWTRSLTANADGLEKRIEDLAGLDETWQQTLARAQAADGTPPDVLQRIEAVIAAIGQTRAAIERRRAQVLALQARVAAQGARITDARDSVRQARNEAVNRLFVKDSPPVWSAEVRARTGRGLLREVRDSFATQRSALAAYAARQREKFFLHAVVVILLSAALYWVRRRVQPWVEAEPSLKRAALVFDYPIAAAFVLSIVAGGWIYPQAPRLWQAVLGAAALVPTIVILRRLSERPLHPILGALVVFYFIDLCRTITASLPVVSRLLLLAETLGAMLFLAWLVKSARASKAPEAEGDRLWKTIRAAARPAFVLFAAAFGLGALGYVSLANLLSNAVLGSAYIAVIFYAATKIADGLIMFALRVRPLVLLGMVREHRPLFRRRVRRVLQALAFLLWLYYTLELLSLRAPLLGKIKDILTAKLVVGSLSLSLGDVIAFGVTVWAAFLLSKFVRFLLNEDVYPRLNLARGVPYAISTTLNYVILLVGFFAALAAMGIDMTKFTILAGAFGVGLGFGLQNIFNNFVSGLIVLFERPVKVGDVVQLNDASGVVKRIGIRASVISTPDGSDVIVPNGKLISDSVTNWTFLSNGRSFVIKVGAAYGTDPRRVIELLNDVAAAHEQVVADPPPQAVFVDFGTDALNFELRVWTNSSDAWTQIRSDLAVAINDAFAAGNISMPYAQRDVHLRSIDPEALRIIADGNAARNGGAEQREREMVAPKSGGE